MSAEQHVMLPSSGESTAARVRAIWRETLELDEVRPEDNFIDLGGDSIAGTLCLNRVRKVFGVDIALTVLIDETVTARELAARIDEVLASAAESARADRVS
jgi:aryl carrier-like protein